MAHAKTNIGRGRKASTDVTDNRFLQKRRQGWYVRVSVPESARAALGGKAHIVKSLGTRDAAEAREKRWSVLATIKEQINEARGYWAQLKVPNKRADLPGYREQIRKKYQSEVAGLITSGPNAEDEWDSPARDEVVDRAHAIDREFGEQEAHRFFKYVTYKSDSIKDVIGQWVSEIEGSVKGQTIGHHKSAVTAFLSASPNTIFVAEVSRKIAGSYITKLDQTSGKARKTIHRHLSSLSSMWKWMRKRGLISENPWEGQSLPKKLKADSASKRPYTEGELIKLLSVPVTEVGEGKYAKPIHELMRLSLMTGARLNELCSLTVEDVDAERQCILIREGKTKAAVRIIPIHSSVWLKIESRAAAAVDGVLFHDCTPGGPDAKRSWKVSSHYSAFRQRVLGKNREVDFHSFRRSFITFFEWAIKTDPKVVHPSSLAEIVGHEKGTLALKLYSGGLQYQDLREAIDAVVKGVPSEVSKLVREDQPPEKSP